VPVILNLSSESTGDRETAARVREAFRSVGAEADVRVAGNAEELVDLARRATLGEGEIVVAGGGDGSIGSIAAVVAESDKVLGVLPLGTLNHFAKDLEIPLDLPGAAKNIVEGRIAEVDVGEVNGRIFVNNSSLGLYPRIVRRREEQREKPGWGKGPALVWATLHALPRHRSLDVVLSVDGREIRRRTPFVFVGNNAYEMEGFYIGTRNRLDRGGLSVYLAPDARPLGLIVLAVRAFFGRLRQASGFEMLRTTELRIETRGERTRVANDGEIAILPTPLRYRVRPRALRVIVPREAAGERAP
jgi:diacylglycerol kinase family enzyme